VLFRATIEDAVWVGIGAIILGVAIPSYSMVPAGSIIQSHCDARDLRATTVEEQRFREELLETNQKLLEGYRRLPKEIKRCQELVDRFDFWCLGPN
jgi:carbonic anhydrase/acetyltransferase-like protein (isoleucine patch superfamily)